ncbi:hypothetical protein [Aquabacter cavernae]|uniref:hypothetical protein n=1 Tax=Aquabacter cavernae TaxID=2496029 RepID=UPI000F8D89D0|nr:hypothetical protein [Aquabacter cavernae]
MTAKDLIAFVESIAGDGDRDTTLRIGVLETRLSDFAEQLRGARAELGAERGLARTLEEALRTERAGTARLEAALAERETQWAATSAALKEIQPALDEAAVNSALLDGSYIWKLIRPVVRLEVRARGLMRTVSRRRRRIEEDAAEVAASGLFDRSWYLENYQDVADSRIDPLRHYLLHGAPEGRDPGPSFSSLAYLEAYPDVVGAGLNPLLHYARYGRAEGRAVFPSRLAGPAAAAVPPAAAMLAEEADLATVKASALFDAEWYLARNADVSADGVDPALHYLWFGGQEGRDPGPRFSSGVYLVQNPDVAKGGINPLLHYLRFGEGEGRALTTTLVSEPALPAPASPSVPLTVAAILPQLSFDCGPGEVAFGGGSSVIGFAEPHAHAVATLIGALRLARHLSGPRGLGLLWSQAAGQAKQALDEAAAGVAADRAEILKFSCAGAPVFADASIEAGDTLRLRLDATGGEARVVAGLQYGRAGLEVIGACSVVEGAPAFADMAMRDAFLPLLLVVTDTRGRLSDACLLPFPCLLRGGSHHGEALACAPGHSGLEAVRRLSGTLLESWREHGLRPAVGSIDLDLTGGTGAERIFDRGLRFWLGDVLGIAIRPLLGEDQSDGAQWLAEAAFLTPPKGTRAPVDAPVLRLPVDGVPTLQALFRGPGPGDSAFAAFVAVRPSDCKPSWMVAPPAADGLDSLQPSGLAPFPLFGGGPARQAMAGERPWPAALRFVDPLARQGVEWVAPFAPEAPISTLVGAAAGALKPEPRVSVVLSCGADPLYFAAVLEALALQHGLRAIQVIASATAETAPDMLPALRRHFPLTGHLVLSGAETARHVRYNRAVELAEADLLAVLGEGVLLHDARTLAAFAALLAQPQVASVSCPLLAGSARKRDERVQMVDAGRFALPPGQTDMPPAPAPLSSLLAALPPAAWPMAAPSADLFMVRRHDWVRRGGFKPGHDLNGAPATAFWQKSARDHSMNLVTFALSATLLSAEGAAPRPPAPDRIVLAAGHEASVTASRIVA